MIVEKYNILLRLELYHEYSGDGKWRGAQLQFAPEMRRLVVNHKLLLRQPEDHVWEVIGNKSLLPVPEIILNVWFQDPGWHWYTAGNTWKQGFEIEIDPTLEKVEWEGEELIWKPVSHMKLGGEIKLKGGEWREQVLILKFRSRRLYWEYILLARVSEQENRELVLEEKEGRLVFGEMERTEWNGQQGWRCCSQETVLLRESYPYILRLLEKKAKGTRVLKKWVQFPQLGQFMGENPEQQVRQVIYY